MDLVGAGLAAAALFAAVIAIVVLVGRRHPAAPAHRALEAVSQQLAHLEDGLLRLGRSQDDLRRDMQTGREASLLQLAEAAQGLRADIGLAHRALAEVKALEQGRARQMDQAAESLKRLETVVAGSSSRGVAGENILARALAQLPPDLIQTNVPFGGRIVEYALNLPGGRFLPIDSKWTSASALERLETAGEPEERRRLVEQVARDVRLRIREMTKYLDPARTLGLAVLAVPDAVYLASPEVHGEGYREGVLVVPYSLALPYVLALYRLTLRFGAAGQTDPVAEGLRVLEEALRRADQEVEGRLSRSLVLLGNSKDALNAQLSTARSITARLVRATEGDDASSVASTVSCLD